MIRSDLRPTARVIPLHRGVAPPRPVHHLPPRVALLAPDLDDGLGFARGVLAGLAIVLPVYALACVALWWSVVGQVLRLVAV